MCKQPTQLIPSASHPTRAAKFNRIASGGWRSLCPRPVLVAVLAGPSQRGRDAAREVDSPDAGVILIADIDIFGSTVEAPTSQVRLVGFSTRERQESGAMDIVERSDRGVSIGKFVAVLGVVTMVLLYSCSTQQ